MTKIRQRLLDLKNTQRINFDQKIVPNLNKTQFLGLSTLELKKIAKDLQKNCIELTNEFMLELPHKYFDENNLHVFILNTFKDWNQYKKALEIFLPYIDNWATCDYINNKIIVKKYKEEYFEFLTNILKNNNETYYLRFAIVQMLKFYLNSLNNEIIQLIIQIKNNDYYVKMAIAWFMAELIMNNSSKYMFLLEKRVLPIWIHNKCIAKISESNKATKDLKMQTKLLKIK